ncbi:MULTISPECIES: hypothetical protein [unclassified Leeuwenhoekiella]|uniref:hypothetical protein n=1 Tax=unclassified Leeuwenhoekiella TaxID=2615029 RepID=UPI000C5C84F5|nr:MULTISPECIES: hypothetical protein [unclassified Leeuwenhoekiella]MBA82988.1 hypothetical protein [Leeuwenhoekiella sp.]|tara:strand:- start:1315 stop:2508 length:1194 start_codon:yes stop_codon:yes gene_type:complete
MKHLITLIFFIFSFAGISQTLKDSVKVIYTNYYELLKTKEKLDTLKIKVDNFEELMTSNNKIIKELSKAELFNLEQQLKQRRKKIINTTEFVFAANASLNAIKQLDATSDYMTQISSLNNPDNTDLGFSLSDEISSLVEQKIIKGNNKINGVKNSKFLLFVDNIIKSPVVQTLSSAVPVVSSIKSVVDLVMGNALEGKDISIDDVVELKKSLKVYLDHYEGLAKAQIEFDQNLNNLDIRKEALILLLTQYTVERANTLNPSIRIDSNTQVSLTEFINTNYTETKVQHLVDEIISANPENFNLHLTNNKLLYPNYALNQAKFIRDEIEGLAKEYSSILSNYQYNLEKVLRNSKTIGDPIKIDSKISDLKSKLEEVKKSFADNLNLFKLNTTFKTLSEY